MNVFGFVEESILLNIGFGYFHLLHLLLQSDDINLVFTRMDREQICRRHICHFDDRDPYAGQG